MESNNGKPPADRQITYQVGWKRGTIQLPGTSRPPTAAASGKREGLDAIEALLCRTAWRPMPWLPRFLLWPTLWAMPVLSFALTVILAYLLMH